MDAVVGTWVHLIHGDQVEDGGADVDVDVVKEAAFAADYTRQDKACNAGQGDQNNNTLPN